MLYVEAARLSTHADASVVSGALETKAVRKSGRSLGEAVTNPVRDHRGASESTKRYDRDGRFQAYKQLPSWTSTSSCHKRRDESRSTVSAVVCAPARRDERERVSRSTVGSSKSTKCTEGELVNNTHTTCVEEPGLLGADLT